MAYVIAALLGYLFGCSHMALYLSKLSGVDLRSNGTGNLGASNAMVLLGWRAGVLTALHDIAKGSLAVLAARWLFPEAPLVGFVAGSAAVLGHMFPFYLCFRGGKGFATYVGMTLVLHWQFTLCIVVVAILLTLVTDYIVTATITTVVAFPIFAAFVFGWGAMLIVCVPSLAMIFKHRENFRRIREGTEVGFRRAKSGKMRMK